MSPQTQDIAVIGAGVTGLTVALACQRAGFQIHLFEREGDTLDHHCSYVGAGMLAPYCELSEAEPEIARWGAKGLPLWEQLCQTLAAPVHRTLQGTLVVAHHQDRPGLQQLAAKIRAAGFGDQMQELRRQEIRALEPDLEDRFADGLYMEQEGEIDPRTLLPAMRDTLEQEGATLYFDTLIDAIEGECLRYHGALSHPFDWILDCRGLDAQDAFPKIRGVRGEIVTVHTPDVTLQRPVRMMHPRYPIYIVPRADQRFVIGATSLESDAMRHPTVRSILELLSAVYALHPGFAEAEILEMKAQLRPTLPDHRPQILKRQRCLHINGMYRHGYLLAPFVAQTVAHFVQHQTWPAQAEAMVHDESTGTA